MRNLFIDRICVVIFSGVLIGLSGAIILPTSSSLSPSNRSKGGEMIWRSRNSKEEMCYTIETDGNLKIKYHRYLGENLLMATTAVILSSDTNWILGYCTQVTAGFNLAYNGFTFNLDLRTSTRYKRWYFSSIRVRYNSSHPLFGQTNRYNELVSLIPHDPVIFLKSDGEKYTCDECIINMFERNESDEVAHKAVLSLYNFRLWRTSKVEVLTDYSSIFEPILAISFLLFVAICLFIVHDDT